MASNYFHNDGRYASTCATPTTYYQSLLDERHPDQRTPSFLTMNTRSDGSATGQSSHSTVLGQSYEFGHFPTRTNSVYPRQGYGLTPDEQAPNRPQLLAPSDSGNPVASLGQPFNPSVGQGIPTYATQQYDQHNLNGYLDISDTSFNDNSFEPTPPFNPIRSHFHYRRFIYDERETSRLRLRLRQILRTKGRHEAPC